MNKRILTLSICSLALSGFGLALQWLVPVMGSNELFHRQCIWTLLGLVLLLCCSRIDFRVWGRLSLPLLCLSLLSLLLVFVPPIGARINGSRRWLHAGPLLFQPSRLAIFALIVFFAWNFAKVRPNFWRGLGPACLLASVCALIVMEVDFATAFLATAVCLAVLRASGVSRWAVFPFYWWPVLLLGTIVRLHGVSWARFAQGFFPFLGGGRYGPLPAYTRYFHWHWFIGGPGGGHEFRMLAPFALNDYVLITLNQELGSAAIVACAVAYFALLMAAGDIIAHAPDRFGRLCATGIIAFFEWSVFLNLAMLLRFLPNKGAPVPFLSFGGSGMWLSLGCVGVLISIARAEQCRAAAASARALIVMSDGPPSLGSPLK